MKMFFKQKKNFFLLCVFVFVGCASSKQTRLENVRLSYFHLIQVIHKILPLGRRLEKQPGRVFYSQYFDMKNGRPVPAINFDKRRYVKIEVLGNAPPYNVWIDVIVEKAVLQRNGRRSYKEVGRDLILANVMRHRFQKALNAKGGEASFLDDFRPF